MAKFKTLEQVKKEFLLRSNGGDKIGNHQTRYSDLEKFAPIVERLLDGDYNKVSGLGFSEIMEAVSLIAENCGTADYYRAIQNDSKAAKIDESLIRGTEGEDNFWSISEALNPATSAQAPYPVPSLNLTLYQYERAVVPYFAHQFDLKGNRGLVYYQRITSASTKGNIQDKDLLGSPKQMSKQPLNFAGSRNIAKEEVATLTSGKADYTYTLKVKPIQPGSLIINVEGATGYFKDFAQPGNPELVALFPVGGDLGHATLNYTTGEVKIDLTTAPSTSGGKIFATYNAEIETVDGGKNIAEAQFTLDSVQLEAEDFSIKTETSIHQEALSKAVFGQDWNELVDDGLAALYNKEVANKIISEIKQEIVPGSIKTHSVNKIQGGNNDLFNVQFLSVVMGNLNKMINVASGFGIAKLSALAINVDVLPLIKSLPKFVSSTADFEEVMGGMYVAGLYDGTPVVVGYDPILAPGEVVGLYKSNKRDFLAPYAWGTFILPIIRDIFDQTNLAVNRKQIISSAAGKVVAKELASKITLTDIDTLLG